MRSDPSVAAAQAQRRAAPEETNGNVTVNAAVALLFIDFEHPNRLRVNGRASLHFDDPLLCEFAGAQLLVRVRARRIFPNCPRYIHRLQSVEPSPYVPRAGQSPPVPKRKRFDAFRDVLPAGDPAREEWQGLSPSGRSGPGSSPSSTRRRSP